MEWTVRARRDDRGSALVELAVALPVLILLLTGIISGGVLYNQKLSATNAAEEGARYGATHDRIDATWATSVAAVVVQRSAGVLTASQVCVSLVSGSGASPQVYSAAAAYSTAGASTPCIASDGSTDTALRVQVTTSLPTSLNAAGFHYSLTLSDTVVSKYEQ
ncbi:MAG: TadE/TadG family type IV pilus assembly protein [Acidimicrobiales bacterium]